MLVEASPLKYLGPLYFFMDLGTTGPIPIAILKSSNHSQGCESVCEKKSEIIWNVWKEVLFNAFKLH